ncbi:MAG: ADP-glyceromanno-heptose 6-epimerase [Rhodospirillaceae bacterium]
MFIVTGGAGFIGSNLVALLEERGLSPLVIVDRCETEHKTRNIAKRRAQRVPPEYLTAHLAEVGDEVKGIFHLGALTSTTERDVAKLTEINVQLSRYLWRWCANHEVPFIYASSAATYGDGKMGFKDDDSLAALAHLQPLNPYGQSKHSFDLWVAEQTARGGAAPPRWAGVKFFNVYGPNEFHKGAQASLVPQVYAKAVRGEAYPLFRSHNPAYADGGQLRDFIFVEDCCEVLLWLYELAPDNGIFNLGTGKARSFIDLASAVYRALGKEPMIIWRDTPEDIRGQYQYFTEARMERLRALGYKAPFTGLEDGVAKTVKILTQPDPYR